VDRRRSRRTHDIVKAVVDKEFPVSKKRHKGVPVHNMSDEPEISPADVTLKDVVREAETVGAVLMAEIEAEYAAEEEDEEDDHVVANGEPSPGPVFELEPSPEEVTQGLATAGLVERVLELSNSGQDEVVDALEELKEASELERAGQPRACPECHRPFVTQTLDTSGQETKSSKIRRMAAAGAKKGDIAKALGISYQFVHNVLSRAQKAS
jgi:hypothetical protein